MRCLALAEALIERGIPCHFQCHGLLAPLVRRVEAAGCSVENLRSVATATDSDADWLMARAREHQACALVIDGYFFGPAYRLRLRDVGLPILAFDDLALSAAYHADLLVNPAPEADTYPYGDRAVGARLLLGPAYTPLRREFRSAMSDGLPPISARAAVLLTFGGSDPLDLTEPVLDRALSAFPEDVQLLVVLGGYHKHRARLEARAARTAPNRIELQVNTSNMARLMLRSGLALTAGGTTLGELAALGVPPVVAVCADNQMPAVRWASAQGLVEAVDARGEASTEIALRLVEAGAALWRDCDRRAEIAERGRAVVDGWGAVRIAEALIDILNSHA